MKIFISQPMRGKTEKEILKERDGAIERIEVLHPKETIEIIDTYFKDFDGNRLQFLGKSIMKLAEADLAVFIGDYLNYDGCACEYYIAKRYGIPIMEMPYKS